MQISSGLMVMLILGVIYIVFNQPIAHQLTIWHNNLVHRTHNEGIARFSFIALGTLFIIYSSLTMFGLIQMGE
jgi:hypothetical protein